MELSVQGLPETSKVKLLGVTVEEEYNFNGHGNQVPASIKSNVVKFLTMKNKMRVTEAIIVETRCLGFLICLEEEMSEGLQSINQNVS